MEERQVQDMTEPGFDDVIRRFADFDEEDANTMASCMRLLLYRMGAIDGTYAPEAALYRFVMSHYNDIDRYLYFIGLRLMSDSITKQVWIAPASVEDGGLFVVFTTGYMSGAQMVLLAVLQKRLAAGSSSEETGADSTTGVLLTEADILKDMFPYIPGVDDEKRKRAYAIAAINKFVDTLGLLRVVSRNLLMSDGTYSNVYRVSPLVQHRFDVVEMDKLLEAAKELAPDTETDTQTVEDSDKQGMFIEGEDHE